MKRSLSTSDIDTSPTGRISIPQETLYEEDEEGNPSSSIELVVDSTFRLT